MLLLTENCGIGTFDQKMTSFCQSENKLGFRVRVRVSVGVRVRVRVRVRAGVSVNTFLIKRVFDQV